MGQRRDRLDKRLNNQILTRQVNSEKKNQESNRRDQLHIELIKSGEFPYTPALMSWMSKKLDKKSNKITPEDVQKLVEA